MSVLLCVLQCCIIMIIDPLMTKYNFDDVAAQV